MRRRRVRESGGSSVARAQRAAAEWARRAARQESVSPPRNKRALLAPTRARHRAPSSARLHSSASATSLLSPPNAPLPRIFLTSSAPGLALPPSWACVARGREGRESGGERSGPPTHSAVSRARETESLLLRQASLHTPQAPRAAAPPPCLLPAEAAGAPHRRGIERAAAAARAQRARDTHQQDRSDDAHLGCCLWGLE